MGKNRNFILASKLETIIQQLDSNFLTIFLGTHNWFDWKNSMTSVVKCLNKSDILTSASFNIIVDLHQNGSAGVVLMMHHDPSRYH